MKLRGIAATRHSVFRYALLGLMLLCVTLCIASCSSSEPMSAKIKKVTEDILAEQNIGAPDAISVSCNGDETFFRIEGFTTETGEYVPFCIDVTNNDGELSGEYKGLVTEEYDGSLTGNEECEAAFGCQTVDEYSEEYVRKFYTACEMMLVDPNAVEFASLSSFISPNSDNLITIAALEAQSKYGGAADTATMVTVWHLDGSTESYNDVQGSENYDEASVSDYLTVMSLGGLCRASVI